MLETADPGGGHCERAGDVRPVDVLLDVAQVPVDVPGVERHQAQLEAVGALLRSEVKGHRVRTARTRSHIDSTTHDKHRHSHTCIHFGYVYDTSDYMCQPNNTHARSYTNTYTTTMLVHKQILMDDCVHIASDTC